MRVRPYVPDVLASAEPREPATRLSLETRNAPHGGPEPLGIESILELVATASWADLTGQNKRDGSVPRGN